MSASRSSYRQLQPEDRVTIASLLLQRHSVRSIARLLKMYGVISGLMVQLVE